MVAAMAHTLPKSILFLFPFYRTIVNMWIDCFSASFAVGVDQILSSLMGAKLMWVISSPEIFKREHESSLYFLSLLSSGDKWHWDPNGWTYRMVYALESMHGDKLPVILALVFHMNKESASVVFDLSCSL